MNGYTIAQLRSKLEAVRGETRVKTAEESIRNEFLNTACQEIFSEFDWEFNRRIEEITIDSDGYYDIPKDFSVMNDFSATGTDTVYTREDFLISTVKGRISITGPTESVLQLTYYIKAPDLLEDGEPQIYFPQPMLFAERAYVRLKTAYFPDESSDKEFKASKAAVRALFVRNMTVPDFTSVALG